MARGGARPGAGRKAGKSANTSPVSRGRAPAREAAGNQRPWPADKVERWSIDRLIPYARNARTHSDEQVAQIAASIREFGFTNPVLVDEKGTLIAGHGRVLGAHQLGITDVPTMVARGWTQAQIQAYRLADNKLALNAGWDPELLRLELGELKLSGFDLSLTGFGDLELAGIMADRNPGLTDPDDQQETRIRKGANRFEADARGARAAEESRVLAHLVAADRPAKIPLRIPIGHSPSAA